MLKCENWGQLTDVISAAKSLAFILITGKKSANGLLAGASNFLFNPNRVL